MTPEQKTHLATVASEQFKSLQATSLPLRTREEVAFQMACESLEAVVAMSHEREVVIYIRQQLARIDAIRSGREP